MAYASRKTTLLTRKVLPGLSAASVAYGYIYTLCAKETESDAKDYTCVGCHSTTWNIYLLYNYYTHCYNTYKFTIIYNYNR